jgi:hypothetical protein
MNTPQFEATGRGNKQKGTHPISGLPEIGN